MIEEQIVARKVELVNVIEKAIDAAVADILEVGLETSFGRII
ncbi:hypothetical protein AB6884_14925 [Carnobacterium maltaromaticum]